MKVTATTTTILETSGGYTYAPIVSKTKDENKEKTNKNHEGECFSIGGNTNGECFTFISGEPECFWIKGDGNDGNGGDGGDGSGSEIVTAVPYSVPIVITPSTPLFSGIHAQDNHLFLYRQGIIYEYLWSKFPDGIVYADIWSVGDTEVVNGYYLASNGNMEGLGDYMVIKEYHDGKRGYWINPVTHTKKTGLILYWWFQGETGTGAVSQSYTPSIYSQCTGCSPEDVPNWTSPTSKYFDMHVARLKDYEGIDYYQSITSRPFWCVDGEYYFYGDEKIESEVQLDNSYLVRPTMLRYYTQGGTLVAGIGSFNGDPGDTTNYYLAIGGQVENVSWKTYEFFKYSDEEPKVLMTCDWTHVAWNHLSIIMIEDVSTISFSKSSSFLVSNSRVCWVGVCNSQNETKSGIWWLYREGEEGISTQKLKYLEVPDDYEQNSDHTLMDEEFAYIAQVHYDPDNPNYFRNEVRLIHLS